MQHDSPSALELAPSAPPGATYLVTFGISGWFDRFTAPAGLELARDDRVVVRSHRGIEFGAVLCSATRGHDQFLHDRPPGTLLRRMEDADIEEAARLAEQTRRVFDTARQLASDLTLPLELLDVESLVEPRTFVLHHLGSAPDVRPFVSQLSKRFDAYVELLNLSGELPARDTITCTECGAEKSAEDDCGSGGGCGTDGQCGTAKQQMSPAEWQAYFAELRKRMGNGVHNAQ